MSETTHTLSHGAALLAILTGARQSPVSREKYSDGMFRGIGVSISSSFCAHQ